MEKNNPPRLNPVNEDVGIMDCLLDDKKLLTVIILTLLIGFFIIWCLWCIPYFQGEHVYNYL